MSFSGPSKRKLHKGVRSAFREPSEDLLTWNRNSSLTERLIIAIDFGTTYSAVSYVHVPKGVPSQNVDAADIQSIGHYPANYNNQSRNDPMFVQVPTELIYPLDSQSQEQSSRNVRQQHLQHGQNAENGDDDGSEDLSMLPGPPAYLRWGYKVHEVLSIPSIFSDPGNQPLSRFKLVLDKRKFTETVRREVYATVRTLKKNGVITGQLNVIIDFLTNLLKHAQAQLGKKGFAKDIRKEMVLCVPAIWTQKACRDMQTCLAEAMKRGKFNGVDEDRNCIRNLFIVSEPEAASAHVLSTTPEIGSRNCFVLLDAGGGTVDANTYRVSRDEPLRLETEIVKAGGGLHGSGYLNEDFEVYLKDRLKHETYLERGSTTIDGIVEKLTYEYFEMTIKRTFDYTQCNSEAPEVWYLGITGLIEDSDKDFGQEFVRVKSDDITKIFMERLDAITKIVREQLDQAMDIGYVVENVVLIGGFGNSPSLIAKLKELLEEYRRENNCHVKLMTPQEGTTITNAVAEGAVLRALDKENGLRRIARSSYGILTNEPQGSYYEHDEQKGSKDIHDGEYYVMGTIDWVLKLGNTVPPQWESKRIRLSHIFDVTATRIICEEELYVSDTATQSHYQLSYPKNQGAEVVGTVEVEFTKYRKQLQVVEPMYVEGRLKGKRHLRVDWELVIKVVGRDLECIAFWNDIQVDKCRVCIASNFQPGTQ